MWSLRIVIAPMIVMMMIQVMMTRSPSRRHFQASPSTTSHPFDTPSTCLMAKPTKEKYIKSDDECESDDCRIDDEEDYSKDELIKIYEQLSTGYEKKRKECKALQKELKALSNPLMSSKHLMSV
jgi:hypothetical protein